MSLCSRLRQIIGRLRGERWQWRASRTKQPSRAHLVRVRDGRAVGAAVCGWVPYPFEWQRTMTLRRACAACLRASDAAPNETQPARWTP